MRQGIDRSYKQHCKAVYSKNKELTCKAVYFKEFMDQNMSQRTMLRFRLWYKFSNNNPIDTTNFTKKKYMYSLRLHMYRVFIVLTNI